MRIRLSVRRRVSLVEFYKGKRVVITGAGKGIGRLLAILLSRYGAHVAILDINLPKMLETFRACKDVFPDSRTFFVHCDVRSMEDIVHALTIADEQLGGIDVVVANAGTAMQTAAHIDYLAAGEMIMDVNYGGANRVALASIPYLEASKGSLFAVSSLAAAVNGPFLAAYNAAKAAIEAAFNAYRIELEHLGIHVGVAYFDKLDTDMTEDGFDTEAARILLEGNPFLQHKYPVEPAVLALAHGIANSHWHIVSPSLKVGFILPFRMVAQVVATYKIRKSGVLPAAREAAIREAKSLQPTTKQPQMTEK